MKRLFILFLSIGFLCACIMPSNVQALSGSEFQAGRIIDDAVFFNGAAISSSDIQLFLNSKVPNCDTNGQQMRGSVTRAQYGASQGYPAPYTCVKDYRENTPAKSAEAGLCNGLGAGNRSAAEIIYEVGRTCGVSQAALLVLLQKEQALITDDWPWSIQYRSATGYGCPDTAPCDAEYYGFFNQVYNAARQFKRYSRDESTYRYRAFRTNFIQFNPNAGCGGSDVFIQNQATAGLYNYTPYQPNASSLNNLYGEGDGCGAYGNRNFWRLYNDWFGSTFSGEHLWRVIRTQADSRLFLQVGNTKRWIPTGDLYNDWGLNQYPVNIVSDATMGSIPEIPELTRMGTDGQYNYIVDNGKRHFLPPQYTSLWGYQNTIAAPVSSLLRKVPEIEPMGRFIQTSPTSFWVMNGGVRHAIAANDLSAWGVNQTNIVTIQSPYLTYIPIAAPLERNIQFSGASYLVDQGTLIMMPNNDIAAAWQVDPYVPINAASGAFMPVRAVANFLVRASNSPDWYMISGGSKYYIASGDVARNWGMPPESMVIVSPDFLSQYPTSSHVLTNLAEDTGNGMVYVLDGQKHHVSNGTLLGTLTADPTANVIPQPSSRLTRIPTGSAYTKPLAVIQGTPHLFLLDKGKRYHVSTGDLYYAFNAWGGGLPLDSSLINSIPMASEELSGVFKDSMNNYYLADDGKKTAIDPAAASAWQSAANPTFSNDFLSLLPNASRPTIASRYVRFDNTTYYIDKGSKTRIVTPLLPSYPGSSGAISQANDTIRTSAGQAAYLIKSTDDQKMWFINNGTRTELSFPEQISLGYLSTTLNPALASNAFLSQFPISSSHSLLVRKQNSGGVKFLNFGRALGFPDGQTLVNTTGSANPVLVVDDFTYDNFSLAGSITRIVKDDAEKLYLIENGQRRWITNGNAYRPYAGIPITYLYGTTMALIPEGQPIN